MNAEPRPAPASTNTSWPLLDSSWAPAGVSATRYSWFLISRGTAMRTGNPFQGMGQLGVVHHDGAAKTPCHRAVSTTSVRLRCAARTATGCVPHPDRACPTPPTGCVPHPGTPCPTLERGTHPANGDTPASTWDTPGLNVGHTRRERGTHPVRVWERPVSART